MTGLAYPWAFQQHSRIAAPLYSFRILFKHQTSYSSRIHGLNAWWSWWKTFQINTMSKQLHKFNIIYKMFWVYDNCWPEAHYCFPCKILKFTWMLLSVTSCKIFFLWDEKSTLNGERVQLWALYVAVSPINIWASVHVQHCSLFFICVHFLLSFSIARFRGYPWWRNKRIFFKGWSILEL